MPDQLPLGDRVRRYLFGGVSGRVFGGMLMLALGSGVGRVIGIAAIPFLTRLYRPEDFGVLAVFTAFMQLLIPIATMRYLVAIPLPRSDRLAFALLILCVGLSFALSIIVAVALLSFGPHLFRLFSMESLITIWWLLAFGMLGASLYEILGMWAARKRKYPAIARTQIVQSAAGEGLKVALGLLDLKPFGLLVGQVAGHSGGVGHLFLTFREDLQRLWRRLSWGHLRIVAWQYRGFPVYRLPAQFLLVFSMQAPLLFVAYIYDSNTTGQLGLAMMIILLPMVLIGTNISRVIYSETATRSARSGSLSITFLNRIMTRLAALSSLIFLVLFFCGETLVTAFLGGGWNKAGQFVSIMSVYLFFQFFASPFVELLNVFSDQRTVFFYYVRQSAPIIVAALITIVLDLQVELFLWIQTVLLSAHYILFATQIRKIVTDDG
jgi:O-antigen/teichoic acid export membrane protein